MLRISICIFLITHALILEAQRFDKVGIDILKLLPMNYNYNSGTMIEPFVTYTLKDTAFSFVGTLGYANIKKQPVYNNMAYYNKGFYTKIGFDAKVSRRWSMGSQLIYSNFTEVGKATLKGTYFGDWEVRFPQKQQLWGIDYHLDFWSHISKRFLINVQYRIALVLSKTFEPYFGTYYAPGFGFLQLFNEDESIKTPANNFTGGLTVRLVYKL